MLLNLSVRDAHALVLAQVLEPGFVHEGFDVARWIGRVVKSSQNRRCGGAFAQLARP
jgi:hypothetical protein